MNKTALELVKQAIIRRTGGKWVLYTHDGKRRLGTHSSRAGAARQERAIQFAKHGQTNDVPAFVRWLDPIIGKVDVPKQGINSPGYATNAMTQVQKQLPWAVRKLTQSRYDQGTNLYTQLSPYARRLMDAAARQTTLKLPSQTTPLTYATTFAGKLAPAFSDPKVIELMDKEKTPEAASKINELTAKRQLVNKPMIKQQAATGLITLQIMTKAGELKTEVRTEIADTPEARRRGLSDRACLPPGYGMLFDKAGAFWMKGVQFPLDIVFLDKQGEILERQHMPRVEDDDPLKPLYVPESKEAACALELPAGWFDQQGLTVGDRIRVAEQLFVC